MSNRDKMEKLAEINTAIDERIDPWLTKVGRSIRASKYTPLILIALAVLVAALSVYSWHHLVAMFS